MSKQDKPVFFENLDALRAIAFGMVFIFHFFGYINYTCTTEAEAFIVNNLILEGHIGVNLFFVLSGFLITYLLIREKENTGRIHIRFFYMRRILRIWPLYFIIVLAGFFVFPLITGQYQNTAVKEHFSYYLFFISNFDRIRTGFAGLGIDDVGILWSVAVEEQFYFFWPLILSVTNKKYYPHVFISLIALSLVCRAIHISDKTWIYFHTFSVMSDLVVGALLAYCCFYKTKIFYSLEQCSRSFIIVMYILLLLSVLFLHDWAVQNTFTKVIERLELSLFFAFIIGEQCFSKNSVFKLGRLKKLSSVGIISYGLYCSHIYGIAVIQKLNLYMHLDLIPKFLFYPELILSMAMGILACYLSYYYFEKRILKLKDKFNPAQSL